MAKNKFGCSDVPINAAACECDPNYRISDEERKRQAIFRFVIDNCAKSKHGDLYTRSITICDEYFTVTGPEEWHVNFDLAKWVSEDELIQDRFQLV